MSVRITSTMLYRSALTDINTLRRRLAVTQERAASGLRINRPSDDPVGVRAATLLRASLEENDQYGRNIGKVQGRVLRLESSIANANDVMVRARELAIRGRNDTNAQNRSELAIEVESLHAELLAQGNAQVGGDFIFSGFATATQPFNFAGFQDGVVPAPSVSYAGNSNEQQATIGQGVSATFSLIGRRVFMGDADGDGNPEVGRDDLFETLADLRDALLSGNAAQIEGSIDRIDTGIGQLSIERTRVGATAAKLERQEELLADESFELLNRLSDVQDADAAEVLSDLVNQEAALTASLQVASRLLQPTLMDFLA